MANITNSKAYVFQILVIKIFLWKWKTTKMERIKNRINNDMQKWGQTLVDISWVVSLAEQLPGHCPALNGSIVSSVQVFYQFARVARYLVWQE